MKKLYTLAITSLLATAGWSQIYVESSCGGVDASSVDVSGTTVFENNIPAHTGPGDPLPENHSHTKFYYKNTTAAEQVISLRRLRVDVPTQWTELLCWAPCDDNLLEGLCVGSAQMASNPWNSTTVTVSVGEAAEIKPDISVISVEGPGLFRFYVVENNTILDSVDLCINCSLSIDEKADAMGMSVYPNPANDFISINTNGLSDHYTVRITDVLGKVVYTDEAGPIKKVDTGDFKNGVYLITVMEKGVALQTRRVVVKH
jgi:hypothetical protein